MHPELNKRRSLLEHLPSMIEDEIIVSSYESKSD